MSIDHTAESVQGVHCRICAGSRERHGDVTDAEIGRNRDKRGIKWQERSLLLELFGYNMEW